MNDIKQQLLSKIGDTSVRETRIKQQVNLKKIQQPQRKKMHWAYYGALVAMIGVLTFSINFFPSVLNEKTSNLHDVKPLEIVPPDDESDDTAVLEKGEYYELLKQKFFPEESEAEFVGGFENLGLNIKTFWLSDYYVQQILSSYGGTIENIYRINGNQIELVYEEMIDGSDRSQMSTDELNRLPVLQIALKAPFELGDKYGDWTLIETSGQVDTAYGSFSDVLVFELVSDETRLRKYYAQSLGMVKWETAFYTQESNEYEIMIQTELSSINPSPVLGNKTPFHFDTKVHLTYTAESHSGWIISPMGLKQATIDGRGEKASEEGEAVLVVQNLDPSETTIFKLKNNENGQYTPKQLAWIDDNRLLIIIGYAHGTVTTGGKLYELNVNDNVVKPVIEDLTIKEEITSVKVNKDGTFTYQKHVYDTDNFSSHESHVEEETMTIPAAK